MIPPSKVHIRPAVPADAEAAGRILYKAFAAINEEHNFPPEIPAPDAGIGIAGMLFAHPGFYCIVAESGGRIIGSNCLDERASIFGLGPITVDPGHQNAGAGRALMQAMLDRTREKNAAGVRLVQSAFHNRSLSLYAKLGFAAREPLSVMTGLPSGPPIEGRTVRPATTNDLAAANQLCERIHGLSRSGELSDGISQGTALVVEREGRLTGYASAFGYLGHSVGETNLDVQALLQSVKNIGGPGILIPTRNAELFRWCLANNMRVLQPMTLMTIGMYQEPTGAYLPSVLF